jgi:AcrR family transcriptional regulator
MSTEHDGRRSAAAVRRRVREKEILTATRALFDERGVRDAQIEDIARAVGINRAIIYRHFSGKEELFALTLVGYLDELEGRLAAADDTSASPTARLRGITGAFIDYGIEFPAFVDCAQTLMRRPGPAARRGQRGAVCGSAADRELPRAWPVLQPAGRTFTPVHLLANALYAWGSAACNSRVGMLGEAARVPVAPLSRAPARVVATSTRWPSAPRPDAPCGRSGYFSRIAVTPWPPAAQIEITPRPEPFSSSSLASVATIRPPVAANGCPAASDDPATFSFSRSIDPSGASSPSRSLQKIGSSHALRVASTCAANASWIS